MKLTIKTTEEKITLFCYPRTPKEEKEVHLLGFRLSNDWENRYSIELKGYRKEDRAQRLQQSIKNL